MTFRTQQNFLWYLNEEKYDECMTKLLSQPQLAIDKASEDHHITGTIKTEAPSQMILTTIPFDQGWKVYIDGVQAHTYETLDALMAFNIKDAGSHKIEMKYMPDCYVAGAALSISGIAIFILICVADFVLKKTLLKNKIKTYPHEYWELEDLDEDTVTLPAPIEENTAESEETPINENNEDGSPQ
jgi:hypothetical protein